MSIAEQWESASLKRRRKCKICYWYDSLTPEDKAFVDDKASGDKSQLHRACVAGAGLDAEITTFRRHFRECVTE